MLNMEGYVTGTCRHCGQVVNLCYPADTQEEADARASENCNCFKAKDERRITRQINDAQERVTQLFGEAATELKFVPVKEPEILDLLDKIVELSAKGILLSSTFSIHGYGKAKINVTGKGKIKVERSETHAYQLEE